MSVNIIWSILMQGVSYDPVLISRKTSPEVYLDSTEYKRVLDTLVPYSDQFLTSFRTEQLINLLSKSTLAARASAYDPISTYSKSTLEFPEAGDFHSALPTGVRMQFYTADTALLTQGQVLYKCTVDPGAGTFTSRTGTSTFTVTNNITSLITIDIGFRIRLKGDLGASPFDVDIWYVADPTTNWSQLLQNLQAMEHVWTDEDLRDIYINDPFWLNKIAAVTMSAVENSRRWQD